MKKYVLPLIAGVIVLSSCLDKEKTIGGVNFDSRYTYVKEFTSDKMISYAKGNLSKLENKDLDVNSRADLTENSLEMLLSIHNRYLRGRNGEYVHNKLEKNCQIADDVIEDFTLNSLINKYEKRLKLYITNLDNSNEIIYVHSHYVPAEGPDNSISSKIKHYHNIIGVEKIRKGKVTLSINDGNYTEFDLNKPITIKDVLGDL